jgi:hypothetical protein
MSDPWIAVVATGIGAAVGAFATFSAQWLQWRRERAARWDVSRKETYSQFLSASEQCHSALWQIAYSAKRDRDKEFPADWDKANAAYKDLTYQRDAVELLAAPASANAAQEVFKRLQDFKQEIYEKYKSNRQALRDEEDYLAVYQPLRDAFLAATRRELGIEGPGRSGAR